jgi:hypothetical protein
VLALVLGIHRLGGFDHQTVYRAWRGERSVVRGRRTTTNQSTQPEALP